MKHYLSVLHSMLFYFTDIMIYLYLCMLLCVYILLSLSTLALDHLCISFTKHYIIILLCQPYNLVLTMKVQEQYCWQLRLAVCGRTCPDVIQKYETCNPLAVHSLGYNMVCWQQLFIIIIFIIITFCYILHCASFSALLNVYIYIQLRFHIINVLNVTIQKLLYIAYS